MPTQFAPTTAIQLPDWAQQNQQQQNPYIQGAQNQVGMPQGWLQAGSTAGPNQQQLPQAPIPPAMQTNNNPLQQQANALMQQKGMDVANGLTGGAAQGIANYAQGVQGAVANQASGLLDSCCFIMIWGNDGEFPQFVRTMRDIAYQQEPDVAQGYKKMSKWLVPLMIRSDFILQLVKDTMVHPLTEHCGWLMSIKGCRPHINYQRFWFAVWKLTSH